MDDQLDKRLKEISNNRQFQSIIIFSDVDGTLVDHSTYSPDRSLEAVRKLQQTGIRLVLCSSKTSSELKNLQSILGIEDQPFIAENGAVLYVPVKDVRDPSTDTVLSDYSVDTIERSGEPVYRVVLGDVRGVLLEKIRLTEKETGVCLTTYDDLTNDQVAKETGLGLADAVMAKRRQASQTIVAPLSPLDLKVVSTSLAVSGVHIETGGRFHSASSIHLSKGRAMRLLLRILNRGTSADTGSHLSVALGDAPNDFSMLGCADLSFLVKQHSGAWAPGAGEVDKLILVDGIGPEGWSMAITSLLGRIQQCPDLK
ncbi:hypothetical protein NDN08_008331 [Rhodosorus marinus]|uniref:Mannosyl-3-phosphoglycerate phosphatase n=1 Tax=Rhodosorus marinus TaxID=101924 RepID=A0AAV8V057_9RHOD|nr:hypothetical protein NDN08_008331 [Rhodosorus marinus]